MSSQREQAVLATLEATSRAWADGDGPAFASGYAQDATAILPGFHLRGRGEIAADMTAAFQGPLKATRRVHEVQGMRFLSEEAALVVTRSQTLVPGEDAAPAERTDLATWVLTRQDGQWLIRSYHGCPAS